MLDQPGGRYGAPTLGAGNISRTRAPPFDPARMDENSFQSWVYDVKIWIEFTDLPPQAQYTAIQLGLSGSARAVSRALSDDERTLGGMAGGN